MIRTSLALAALAAATSAHAQEFDPAMEHAGHDMAQHEGHPMAGTEPAAHAHHGPDAHAPIGVMGDHTHGKGEMMLAYRYMHMAMRGSQVGTEVIAPDTIVTTVPNRFAGTPGQPPTLRVVPRDMAMDMHMLGFMYAPADWVTLMAMGSYVTGEMHHITYRGGAGTEVLGTFDTETKGIGDLSMSGLFPVMSGANGSLSVKLGVNIPTGSTTKTGEVLTPMDARMTMRLPYAMQLGSGTWDVLAGTTATGHSGAVGWGGQLSGVIRTGSNDQGYSLGDKLAATAWASYTLAPWISASLRVAGQTVGRIDGIDPQIVAPVQTADPANYGGEKASVLLGANLLATGGALKGYRLGIEAGVPVYQDLNGPQLKDDWSLMVGVQKAF